MYNPIFIGSDGRSGSTLLAMILDSHPDIAFSVELHFKGCKNLGQYALDYIYQKHNNKDARQFVARVARNGIDSFELAGLISTLMTKSNYKGIEFSERCLLIDGICKRIAWKQKKKYYGLKIMREIRNIKSYLEAWPNAIFIHIIRNGLDVAASQMFLDGNQYLRYDAWGYKSIEQAAESWKKLILNARENAKDTNRYFEVQYEDLLFTPKLSLMKLCNEIGIEWHDNLLKHDRINHVFFNTNIVHPSREQCKKLINSNSFERYKKELTKEQIEIFIKIADDLLKEFKYI